MNWLSRLLRSLDTRHYLILAALWTAGIIVALTIPAPGLPKVDPSLTLDKFAHVILFGGLAIFWMRALRPDEPRVPWTIPWRRVRNLFLGGLLFAVGSEFYQLIIPFKRSADPYDALADVVGLVLGLGTYLLYRSRTVESNEEPAAREG
ncbi:VanZ family protein [Longibacter salinarum]|nr:VanZ family protein [Longibacter salinarum]